jgi:hypothetical protein
MHSHSVLGELALHFAMQFALFIQETHANTPYIGGQIFDIIIF